MAALTLLNGILKTYPDWPPVDAESEPLNIGLYGQLIVIITIATPYDFYWYCCNPERYRVL